MSVEYLGKVNNIITAENLKSAIGMNQGTNIVTGDISFLKFNDNGKIIYVASSVISTNITWNYLESLGMITGKDISVNDKRYICRLISGSNGNSGVTDDSEWKRLIIDLVPNKTDSNWGNVTLCKESYYYSSTTYAITRGGATVDTLDYCDKSSSSAFRGFRPVFEISDIVDFIGVAPNLGNISTFNGFSYNANSLNGGNFNLVEKINEKVIRTLNNQPGGDFVFRIDNFDLLPYGNHTIEIVATDITTNKDTVVTSKFNKVKSPVQPIPTNSNLKQIMLHNKELEKEISYQNFRLRNKFDESGTPVGGNGSLSNLVDTVINMKKSFPGEETILASNSNYKVDPNKNYLYTEILTHMVTNSGGIRLRTTLKSFNVNGRTYNTYLMMYHRRNGNVVNSAYFTTTNAATGIECVKDFLNIKIGDVVSMEIKSDESFDYTGSAINSSISCTILDIF